MPGPFHFVAARDQKYRNFHGLCRVVAMGRHMVVVVEPRSGGSATAMPEAVAIASDHAGIDLKRFLMEELRGRGLEPLDLGAHDAASVDYPDFANALANILASGRARRGVLICGTGI